MLSAGLRYVKINNQKRIELGKPYVYIPYGESYILPLKDDSEKISLMRQDFVYKYKDKVSYVQTKFDSSDIFIKYTNEDVQKLVDPSYSLSEDDIAKIRGM